MSNYYKLRTKPLFDKPIAGTDLGRSSAPFGNLYLKNNLYIDNVSIAAGSLTVPRVTAITYALGRSTAVIAGNETLTLTGTGFVSGINVLVDDRPVDTTNFTSSTEITFTTPARNAGVYSLFVVNPDGSTGALATGIEYGA